jgi:hypothetical protein
MFNLSGVQGEPCTSGQRRFKFVSGEPCTSGQRRFKFVSGEPCTKNGVVIEMWHCQSN